MADLLVDFNEVLVTPLADMVERIGQGIAEAQRALDEAALATQKSLKDQHPELDKIGYQVTWYQMPEVLVELKMALHYERTDQGKPPGFFLSPFNAKYKRAFEYSAEGASTLKLKIVPVPPPVLSDRSE